MQFGHLVRRFVPNFQPSFHKIIIGSLIESDSFIGQGIVDPDFPLEEFFSVLEKGQVRTEFFRHSVVVIGDIEFVAPDLKGEFYGLFAVGEDDLIVGGAFHDVHESLETEK